MKNEEKEKSRQIIGSAMDLFMRFGVKSLTMDDISRKLGISKKTLYQIVSDKKELVKRGMAQCLEDDQDMIAEITTNSDNAIDELIGFTRNANEWLSEVHESVVFDIQKYHPECWGLIEAHKKDVRKAIFANTKRGMTEGLYRKNLNPEIIASLYVIMKDAMFDSIEIFGKGVRIQDLHLEMIRYHVRGVANDKGMALLKEALNKEENNHLNLD